MSYIDHIEGQTMLLIPYIPRTEKIQTLIQRWANVFFSGKCLLEGQLIESSKSK